MIYPFAIQPEVIVDWCSDRRDTRQAEQTIGPGKPRYVLRLPKELRKKCFEVFLEGNREDFDGQRLTAFLGTLCENAINRPNQKFDKSKDWLWNAQNAYERQSFRGIIAYEENGEHVINGKTIFEESNELWEVKSSQLVLRNAFSIASALEPLLVEGLHCYLVDPYFSPGRRESRAVIRALAAKAVRGLEISIRCTAESKGAPTLKYFNDQAAAMAKDLPITCKINFKRLKPFHDRYFLTPVGGLSSTNSFEHYENQTDEMHFVILGAEDYSKLWNDYEQPDSSKVVDTPNSVVGKREKP